MEVQRTWVFDVDGCLVDALSGTSLRPGAAESLRSIRDEGDRILLWSAGGADYARDRAVQHGLEGFFESFHSKEGRDESGRYLTDQLGRPLDSLVFVDDQPGDLPEGADVIGVRPYLRDDPRDEGLELVNERLAT